MHAPFDQLGKNVLRDFFVLLGTAEPQAEVPASDAQAIDLWAVPDPARAHLRAQAASGLLLEIALHPAMIELFVQAVGDRAFHDCGRKRYQWRHVLELRDQKPWDLPILWLISGGRPDGVLEDYGFERAVAGPLGHYALAAWRIHIVAVSELPRTRDTILFRLLGASRVRLAAIQDLLALPDDAWEKKLALPWLGRLRFEVPPDPAKQSDEERDFIMETQAWFEQYQHQLRNEGRNEGRDEGRLQALGRLFARRLGRPLADEERHVLAVRLARLGEDRLDDVVLELRAEALAAWLADPAAR